VQPTSAYAVCEIEQQLMCSWSLAVEDFSRVISMFSASEAGTREYSRLRSEAENARLSTSTTHISIGNCTVAITAARMCRAIGADRCPVRESVIAAIAREGLRMVRRCGNGVRSRNPGV
jgi:hypothetical protein